MDFRQGDVVLANVGGGWRVGIFQKFATDSDGFAAAIVACGSEGEYLAKQIKPVPLNVKAVDCTAVPPRWTFGDKVRYVNLNGKVHDGVVEDIQATSYQYRLRNGKGAIELLTEMQLVIGTNQALELEER